MCLAVPMQIKAIDGNDAVCEAQGIRRTVSLFMLQDERVGIGDFVLVHVGYAIQKIQPREADATWAILNGIG